MHAKKEVSKTDNSVILRPHAHPSIKKNGPGWGTISEVSSNNSIPATRFQAVILPESNFCANHAKTSAGPKLDLRDLRICHHRNMVNQSAFQGLLIKHLESRQLANPKYSVRAFARDLHLSASAVNEIIKGERRVSVKFVEKLATKLEISTVEMSKIVGNGPDKIAKKNLNSISKTVQTKRKNQTSRKIEENQIEYISNWIHFAILSLIETKNFRSSPGRMAQRLGVDLEQVQYALIRLQQLNLITVANDGSISRCVSSIQTSEDVLSKALQLCHQNDMILAQQKMQQLKVDERDFTSFTFCGNPEKIKLGKQIIREAQEQLEQIMRDEEAQDVYRVCMYLFPLTKIETSHAS